MAKDKNPQPVESDEDPEEYLKKAMSEDDDEDEDETNQAELFKKKIKKSDDNDEDDEEGDEDDEEEEDEDEDDMEKCNDPKMKKGVKKSFDESSIAKAIDAIREIAGSDTVVMADEEVRTLVKSLNHNAEVDQLKATVDQMRGEMAELKKSLSDVSKLAAAVETIVSENQSLKKSFSSVQAEVETVKAQPTLRKSFATEAEMKAAVSDRPNDFMPVEHNPEKDFVETKRLQGQCIRYMQTSGKTMLAGYDVKKELFKSSREGFSKGFADELAKL